MLSQLPERTSQELVDQRNVTIIESRWFDALPANLQADVIVSTPRTSRWTARMSTGFRL